VFWFIVAIISFHNSDEVVVKKMAKAFQTKELCQTFYQTNMSVRNDVLLLEPTQRGHTLVCLQQTDIDNLDSEKLGV